ncbi:unnamed protein product [Haemonchus placei]|uniref:Type IV pilus assembly protein PilM n=1 Tax=Haemonchus placei TaxID=6290 RepID=A0A0N4W2I4_HAEPC|nr:unnamed protein product [Haemonchus placei]
MLLVRRSFIGDGVPSGVFVGWVASDCHVPGEVVSFDIEVPDFRRLRALVGITGWRLATEGDASALNIVETPVNICIKKSMK